MLNLPSIHSFKDIMTCKNQFYFNVIIIVMQLHDMCMPTSRKVTAWKFQGVGGVWGSKDRFHFKGKFEAMV